MDQPMLRMDPPHRSNQLDKTPQHIGATSPAVQAVQFIAERALVDPGHHQMSDRLLTVVPHRDHPGLAGLGQQPGDLDLGGDHPPTHVVECQLDRHGLAVFQVLTAPDLAEGSLADSLDQPVARQLQTFGNVGHCIMKVQIGWPFRSL